MGSGGIASGLLPYLVSSGIGHICIIDDDIIERTNLARQTLFCEEDIGQFKGLIAQRKLNRLNPHIEIVWQNSCFNLTNAIKIAQGYDLILEGTDDIQNKFMVNDFSLENNIPALIGGLGSTHGHIFPVHTKLSNQKCACYRCVFEAPPSPENELPTCANAGILSPLPGVIGSMMAYLTTLFFIDKKLANNLFLLEKYRWRTLSIKKNPNCLHCVI